MPAKYPDLYRRSRSPLLARPARTRTLFDRPGVTIEIEGKGSATAPPALLEGASEFGPMSRPMNVDEIDAFEKKYGYKPAHFRVAVDALAIYVNKDNPILCLTLQQLDQIFSSTRQGSGSRSISALEGCNTWG
jgi:phosphate transport system substrate-binding protein